MEKILFVAPTETVAKTAAQVSSEMGVSLPIVVCKSQEIPSIVEKYSDITIYISRGVFLTCNLSGVKIDDYMKEIWPFYVTLLVAFGNYDLLSAAVADTGGIGELRKNLVIHFNLVKKLAPRGCELFFPDFLFFLAQFPDYINNRSIPVFD
jgi:hypothetical protein